MAPLLVAAVALLGILVVGLWIVLYQVVRQQGRLLLRLEEVEQDLSSADPRTMIPIATVGNGQESQPRGLPVGATVPRFRLPDLMGKLVGLDNFRGKRVLLVHWSPECGFCIRIATDIGLLQSDLHKHNIELMLVSHGDAEGNRRLAEEYGLACPIVLQQEGKTPEAFEHMGTPVAYVVDEQGRVANPVAIGADEVLALARDVSKTQKKLRGERPLSESRIERDGLKPGTPAPGFSLPDLDGHTVSLERYRGRRVLLVFSDPQCGPCSALLPDLVKLYKEHHDDQLEFVMISRGVLAENRRKAEDYAIEFPVVLQPNWRLSKEYGIFATPVAFLINETGTIVKKVAKGPDEILSLVQEELAVGREKVDKMT